MEKNRSQRGTAIEIHIHLHFPPASEKDTPSSKALEGINQIQKTLKKFIMDNQKDFDDALAAIDLATTTSSGEATRIVGVVEDLRQDVIDAGLPKASEDAILAKLGSIKTGGEALATFLKAVGVPANPVPEPVVAPEDEQDEEEEEDV